ncbi:carboxylating nicotinate-nucleotide diphosphorylase [Kitasatospora sp. NBC_00240]|uniref:carboxylating nicotinate-nucleotide diphosphorylase n=1 Tax=Kitasatospora sp. NBC_00240 TaxID=2903567 RepID=UPI002250F10A|nr:carboxylating nicotinate-nucleotide diphosphorylase [Kitasatospora sp. NBC_00240]MCX5210104.1 carboxylating nicotinate-nucleotide diphosphorylase [Kitasatospora sp. NBC_00240]
MTFPIEAARRIAELALAEDAAGDDITTRWSVPAELRTEAVIITRQPGVAAGLPIVAEVFARVDPEVKVVPVVEDGARLAPNDVLVELSGPARSLITGERTVLNLLQRMSGIATFTSHFADAVQDLPVRVLDTRKTAPGLRALDKYAVTAGGGTNHRLDLAAMVLLKENHVAAAGGVTAAVRAVQAGRAAEGREVLIDVEVQSVAEAEEALRAGASWIMLDNMTNDEIRSVVRLRAELAAGQDITLEASGTITLDRIRAIAETGIDAVSIGALTHSAPALDLSMLIAGA